MRYVQIAFWLLIFMLIPLAHSSYIITGINTTVALNQNTSAQVVEIMKLSISNQSVSQYATDRLALNLTLSQWQNLIGPTLVEHIVNPHGSIYDFNFLPGPIITSNNGKIAYLVLSYSVSNVSVINQTGPRTFVYNFQRSVFNFQNAESGEVLGQNTTLEILLPSGSRIDRVSPNPDFPQFGFTQNYKNVTKLVWSSDESLSNFGLSFTLQESLQQEVLSFFRNLYSSLGGFAYVIIVIAIALFILYTYLKVGR